MIQQAQENNTRILSRDTPAILIPAGTPIVLPGGTPVIITQALGHSYTVNIHGNLARIESQDADALGEDIELPTFELPEGDTLDEDYLYKVLSSCYDPEIPVNIVDLGLIYKIKIDHTDDKNLVEIDMTLTAPGCGIGPVLIDEIQYKVKSIPEVDDVKIELVFDPPWNTEMMTDEAKLQLGLF